ncbi:MAG TPA: septal ring lytic transglycosylase RlpA family protein [Microvirga sp.]|nr:septal ring lytic transglycosylase RlpA family protein [Microvirga sp.]
MLARAALLAPCILVAACGAVTTAEGPGGAEAGRQIQRGHASWYGPGFHGRRTASGETFRADGFTAAHRSLPFGTRVRVVNEGTGRSVVVRINDRGPFHGGRIIDIAQAPARSLGLLAGGSALVSLHQID